MFTEETIGRDDVREPALSTLDADFAAHATAIEELYRTILTEIADAARAWTPETARLEAPAARTEAITLPRSEPRTEAITAPRTDAITVQQAEAPVRTRGAHHAETGQMAAITVRPGVRRTVAA